VLLSRTNGFTLFSELIGEKQHVGSYHRNGGFAVMHPFCFRSQGQKIPDKRALSQISCPVAHC